MFNKKALTIEQQIELLQKYRLEVSCTTYLREVIATDVCINVKTM